MDSVAVQASVPTFERSHRAFHRERTVNFYAMRRVICRSYRRYCFRDFSRK